VEVAAVQRRPQRSGAQVNLWCRRLLVWLLNGCHAASIGKIVCQLAHNIKR